MLNVKIKHLAIYHPENVVSNEYYINHFDKQGKDITNFLAVMGRKNRYIIDNKHENSLTMAIEASKLVLQKASFTGQDIDLIVFSSQIPETTFPTNALLLHEAIQAGTHTIVLDSNANCAGMTLAVEQASRYMQANPHVKTALVVGSDYNSLISNPEEAITYANYGDAASAVILEKTEEDTGFIDAIYYTDTETREMIMYPSNGLSNALNGTSDAKYIQWLPFSGDKMYPPTYKMVEDLLQRNNLSIKDIKAFCLSQFSLRITDNFKKYFDLDESQIVYVGDRFGYTGTSSPFIALHEGIESGQIKRGDHVIFWTVGAGYQLVAMLFKY